MTTIESIMRAAILPPRDLEESQQLVFLRNKSQSYVTYRGRRFYINRRSSKQTRHQAAI